MLDAALRRLIDPPLDTAGRALAGRGVSADAVTVAGFLIGLAAFPALAIQAYPWALAALVANRLADGLDGAVARATAPSDLGGYLDIVCDFIFYAGFVCFFAIGRPDHALMAAILIFSFIGTASTFLAYAIIAAKRGVTTSLRGRKSLYYLGGLAEGTETIAVLALICLLPDRFALIAGVFAAMCWVTTATRIAAAVIDFRDYPAA